jgi:hypothetical protein
MVRTAIGCGAIGLAQRLADLEPRSSYHEHAICASHAVVAEGNRELESARDLYAEAARRWKQFGVVPERAFALLGQGRCLVTLRRPEAVAVLREARDIFASLGATPSLDEVDGLLERAISISS